MAKRKKLWIQDAIHHPGSLHRLLGVPEGALIPDRLLQRAKRQGGKIARKARLAETLKRLRKKRA
jgi:hypothetical protein